MKSPVAAVTATDQRHDLIINTHGNLEPLEHTMPQYDTINPIERFYLPNVALREL